MEGKSGPLAHDAFISYSHLDKPAADGACAVLEAAGVRCWIAPRDIAAGAEWGEAIVDAIDSAAVMVLVFSAHANNSAQVRREVERAVNAGVTIMPVRIEPVSPARSLAYFMAGVHWLDALTPPLEQHLRQLAATIEAMLKAGADDQAAASPADTRRIVEPPVFPPETRGGFAQRHAVLAGLSLAIALGIAAAAGWKFIWEGHASPAQKSLGESLQITQAVPPAAPEPSIDAELLFWQTIATSSKSDDFEEYLRRYPNGQFSGLARTRLAALQAPTAPNPPAEGEQNWTLNQKRDIQRALRALGHYQGEADGAWGAGTRAAIQQFQSFANDAETGELTESERKLLLEMAQRLAALLDQPSNSPQGVAAASVKGTADRYARGYNFDAGKGVKADPAEAAYWYGLAAADGEPKAFTNLAKLLARGFASSKPNPTDAELLWWAAAARGEPNAMYNLGVLFERGIGVAPDAGRARVWYERAAAHNDPDARAALKRLG